MDYPERRDGAGALISSHELHAVELPDRRHFLSSGIVFGLMALDALANNSDARAEDHSQQNSPVVVNSSTVIRTVEGRSLAGQMLGIADGEIRLLLKDGTERRTSLDTLESIRCQGSLGLGPLERPYEVTLRDGSLMSAAALARSAKGLEVQGVLPQSLSVPLRSVAAVRMIRGAAGSAEWNTLQQAPPAGEDWVVLRKNGILDPLEVTVKAVESDGVTVVLDDESRKVSWAKLEGVIFSTSVSAQRSEVLPVAELVAGPSRLALRSITYEQGGEIQCTTIGGQALSVPARGIELDFTCARYLPLGSLQGKVVEWKPVPEGGAVPSIIDELLVGGQRPVEHGPILLGTRQFSDVLRLGSALTIAFPLRGEFSRLDCCVIPLRAGGEETRITFLGDGKALHSMTLCSEVARAGCIEDVSLSLTGVRQLTIQLQGTGGVGLVTPRLLRAPR